MRSTNWSAAAEIDDDDGRAALEVPAAVGSGTEWSTGRLEPASQARDGQCKTCPGQQNTTHGEEHSCRRQSYTHQHYMSIQGLVARDAGGAPWWQKGLSHPASCWLLQGSRASGRSQHCPCLRTQLQRCRRWQHAVFELQRLSAWTAMVWTRLLPPRMAAAALLLPSTKQV